jgi:hypothetical protein
MNSQRPDSTFQGRGYWQYECGTCRASLFLSRRRIQLARWTTTPHPRCVPNLVWNALDGVKDRRLWNEVFNIVRGSQFQKWIDAAM